MTFSLRLFLIVVAWLAIVIGAITAMLKLPSRTTDLPVGLLFALVFFSSAFAIIRAVLDRSTRRRFWIGYALVCVGCGLIAHSEPLMRAHTLPHYAATSLLSLRDVPGESIVRRNEVYLELMRAMNLGLIPILAVVGGTLSQAFVPEPSANDRSGRSGNGPDTQNR